MYTIILNSGHEVKNVKPRESNRSFVGLFIWSVNQRNDVIISTSVGSFRSSQIAAILEDNPGEYNYEQSPVDIGTPFDYMTKEEKNQGGNF